MKTLVLSFLAVALFAVSAPASAETFNARAPGIDIDIDFGGPSIDRRPGRPGRPGHPGRPGFGPRCTVAYKVCQFSVNGFCVKDKKRSFTMNCRAAYDRGCWEAQRREGQRIHDCRVYR